jgi:hypothetical protein
LLGYIAFAVGAGLFWRHRAQFSVWAHDEFWAVRRSFSRYTMIGPFYSLREESRFKAVPLQCFSSLSRFPARNVHAASLLLVLGTILFALDFFL